MPHAMIMVMPPLLVPVAIACSLLVLVIASLNDIAARTLPNWTSVTLALIGIALRCADHTLLFSVSAGCGMFLLGMVFWQRGWLGGGDVKLLSACTLLVPPGQVLSLVMMTAMAGGVLAALYLVLRHLASAGQRGASVASHAARPTSLIARVWRVERWRISRRGSLPYGCAIASAVAVLLLAPGGAIGN